MPLPVLKRCCGCIPLRPGCILLCVLSTLACIANIVAGSWNLPRHWEREPEDNVISMNMVMFSTFSAISDLMALGGIFTKRSGYLQLSIMCNSVFILCIFLVAIVTCLFSPEMAPFLEHPANIVLVIFLIIAGALFSLYYLMVVNSWYRRMKMPYSDTAIPV